MPRMSQPSIIDAKFDRELDRLVNEAIARGHSEISVATVLAAFGADIVAQCGGNDMARRWIEDVAEATHWTAALEDKGAANGE